MCRETKNEGNIIHDHGINIIMAQLASTVFTGPKIRFPLMLCLPKHELSDTYLAEDRAEFL